MLEAIRRAMAFLRQKQILHRLGVVISIAVIGIACYVLYHMLRGIDTNEVLEAIKRPLGGVRNIDLVLEAKYYYVRGINNFNLVLRPSTVVGPGQGGQRR